MGGKGGKRKCEGLAVPGYRAGGIRTPSATLSASGSMAGVWLGSGISYDVMFKVLRVDVAGCVADMASLSE